MRIEEHRGWGHAPVVGSFLRAGAGKDVLGSPRGLPEKWDERERQHRRCNERSRSRSGAEEAKDRSDSFLPHD